MNKRRPLGRREVVVIGAGPAGLTAATYLARYHREVLVLDGGRSRAEWIPETHNTPGFPNGIGGRDLLARFRAQALEYGATLRKGRVRTLETSAIGFRATGRFGTVEARAVLLATGVVDRLPRIPGIEEAIRLGRVRMCPICDAYEATGRRLAVLGNSDFALREAEFLRTYSADVRILQLGGASVSLESAERVRAADFRFEPEAVRLLRGRRPDQTFDHLYLALGCEAQSGLAAAAGARADDLGKLLVDSHQMTSVEGLYAAGDVVRGLNQITVGTGEAAIAATAIHNRLRGA